MEEQKEAAKEEEAPEVQLLIWALQFIMDSEFESKDKSWRKSVAVGGIAISIMSIEFIWLVIWKILARGRDIGPQSFWWS